MKVIFAVLLCNDTNVVSEEPRAANRPATPRTIGWSRPGADDGEGRFLTYGSGRLQLRAQRRISAGFPFHPSPAALAA